MSAGNSDACSSTQDPSVVLKDDGNNLPAMFLQNLFASVPGRIDGGRSKQGIVLYILLNHEHEY